VTAIAVLVVAFVKFLEPDEYFWFLNRAVSVRVSQEQREAITYPG
jgi:hypothetical protein